MIGEMFSGTSIRAKGQRAHVKVGRQPCIGIIQPEAEIDLERALFLRTYIQHVTHMASESV